MSREAAKEQYTRKPDDPTRGFVSSADAQTAIDIMYDDLWPVGSARIAAGSIGPTHIDPSLLAKIMNVPSTSVDNTVVRFDGATGALQGSGVTITDGGAIQSDASSGEFRFGSAAGSIDFILSGYASGNNAAIFLRTGTAKRWFVGKEATSESGSDAGSNFRIWRYHDDGTSIGEALGIRRDTGKVTIGAANAAAGLEMGSGGPTWTVGTGAPSHSAPNGSLYTRQDGAAGTTLYVRAAGAWVAK